MKRESVQRERGILGFEGECYLSIGGEMCYLAEDQRRRLAEEEKRKIKKNETRRTNRWRYLNNAFLNRHI